MQFTDNFCELSLLLKQPVHFVCVDDDDASKTTEFDMRLPTVRELYFDTRFMRLLGLLHKPITELTVQFPNIEGLSTHFQLFNTLLLINYDATNVLVQQLIYSWNVLGIPLKRDGIHYYINDLQLTYNIFTRITDLILLACDLKRLSELSGADDPQQRVLQEKINKIKARGNKVKGGGGKGDLKEMVMILTYEFGYKIDEIITMNMYLINTILSYTGKSINYKVSLIAAGNGNTKKVHFITK